MRTFRACVVAALLFAPLSAPPAESETALSSRVWVRPLSTHAWLIRSVSVLEGFGEVESNAVLATGGTESVLIDTPATEEQTMPVLAWAEKTLHRPVRHIVITHWHADRMGGIGATQGRRIATYALGRTRALARDKGLVVPEHELGAEARLVLSDVPLEVWYPGHGHTIDNIVVWLPVDALLVGGCFVKAAESNTLGNVREIDPTQWAIGIAALRGRYPESRTVIPGHGAPGGPELLVHTAELLAANAGRRPSAPAP